MLGSQRCIKAWGVQIYRDRQINRVDMTSGNLGHGQYHFLMLCLEYLVIIQEVVVQWTGAHQLAETLLHGAHMGLVVVHVLLA